MRPAQHPRPAVLWSLQGLLAALFLFAGLMKLALPAELLRGPVPLPTLFLRFVGVAEVAGAIGLIVPGLLRIHRELTPLAAVGLVTIMTGATVVTIEGGQFAAALLPVTVGSLAMYVALARSRTLAPARLAEPRGVEIRQTYTEGQSPND